MGDRYRDLSRGFRRSFIMALIIGGGLAFLLVS